MALKLGAITLSNVKLGSNQIAKVMLGVNKIWEYLVNGSYSNSWSWYARKGSSKGGGSSDFTIASGAKITHVSCGTSSSSGTYYLYAKVNSSDNWTTIFSDVKSINTDISDDTMYYYFRFGATNHTYTEWIDPAGVYYWCEGSLSMNYKYRPS